MQATESKPMITIDPIKIDELRQCWLHSKPYHYDGTDFFVAKQAGAFTVEFWLMRKGKSAPVFEYEDKEKTGFCIVTDLID